MFARLQSAIGIIRTRLILWILTAVATAACSTFQPPDANGPRANNRPYPVIAVDDDTRTTARLAWKNLSTVRGASISGEPRFNVVTGTLESLPTAGNAQVFLPKVGGGPTQTEEETRESLRRFINDWHEVIGAEPAQLSLVERVDESSGLKLAHYEQRPFRLPLRGGFGQLLIRFRADRQIVELSSNCIPNTDRIQASLATMSPQISAEEAVAHVSGRAISVTDGNGRTQSFTIASGTQLEAKQLVVYALPSADKLSLELHLAWEIAAPNGAIKSIYLDAITDEVIAAN
jgi:hypothetical protein